MLLEFVEASSTGFTERTMILVAPRATTCSWACLLAPSPMASIAITEYTPNTMPSMVNPDRSLWSIKLFKPRRTVRTKRYKDMEVAQRAGGELQAEGSENPKV